MKILILTLALIFVIETAKADNFNLTSNAAANLIGLTNIELSAKLFSQYTLGIRATQGHARLLKYHIDGSAYGIIARRYFNEALSKDSWYLGTSLDQQDFEVKVSSNGFDYSGSQKELIVGIGGGYHWFWNSFNMSFGGYFLNSHNIDLLNENRDKYEHSFGSHISLELNVGGKF